MRVSTIRKLIKIVEESKIGELEISSWGHEIRISKNIQKNYQPRNISRLEVIAEDKHSKKEEELIEIKSPMVGTFYRSPPLEDSKPYVEIGQKIKEKQIIYRIEAMGLVNEIESDYSGRIVERLVGDEKDEGVPIEFGQVLFLIEPYEKN